MPAKKTSKSKSVKKTAGAGAAVKKGTQAKKNDSGGNNSAFFILIIIVLVTIIVLMVNRFLDRASFTFPDFKRFLPVSDGVKEQKSITVKDKKVDELKKTTIEEQARETETKEIDKTEEVKPARLQKEVNIYLLKLDEKTDRIFLSPVKRIISDPDILSDSMDNLIKGPTLKEKNRGYITAIPQKLKIRSIAIKGKIAEIDFNSSIEEGAAGDILLKRVQQIVYTATQFENVESVIIRINGERRKSMGSDGFSISGPLKR